MTDKNEEEKMIDPVELLEYFGLRDDPFTMVSGDRVYRSKKYKLSVTLLEKWLRAGEMCALLGEPGSGKTTLVADLREQCARNGVTLVAVGHPNREDGKSTEVYTAVALAFGEENIRFRKNSAAKFVQLREFIGDTLDEDRRVALVVDEAHRVRSSFLRAMKEFNEISWGLRTGLLGVLFVAWPCFLSKARHSSPDIYKRLMSKSKYVDAGKLMSSEVGEWVRQSCRRCGNAGVFSSGALQALGVMGRTPLDAIGICWGGMTVAYKAGAKKVLAEHLICNLDNHEMKRLLGWTTEDIAERAGVNRHTVSSVLNGNHSVAEATRNRVEEVLRTGMQERDLRAV